MTDRELLELAAKAAGIVFDSTVKSDRGLFIHGVGWWNPCEDDGDALRLAVKLKFDVHVWSDGSGDTSCGPSSLVDTGEGWILQNSESNDPYTATRRAIVRAAAELGKQMESANGQ